MLVIEVKLPGKKATRLQLYELEQWKRVGAQALIAYDLEEVRSLIEKIRTEKVPPTKGG